MRLRRYSFFVVVVLIGCIPVETPPQLVFTPGNPIMVTEDSVNLGLFEVDYPRDWRVITSAAEHPPGVIFVSPDGRALIMFSTALTATPPALEETIVPLDAQEITARTIPIDKLEIGAWMVTDSTYTAEYALIFEIMIHSIK